MTHLSLGLARRHASTSCALRGKPLQTSPTQAVVCSVHHCTCSPGTLGSSSDFESLRALRVTYSTTQPNENLKNAVLMVCKQVGRWCATSSTWCSVHVGSECCLGACFYLWSSISFCECALARHRIACACEAVRHTADAPVTDARLPMLVQQDVVWLDVCMYDLTAV